MTGCLFFLYIGALGLPVSIQLHCLMLPYSMQTEDEEKGIYKGITGCMPLYAYAKEQVEADGQDLATTYILLKVISRYQMKQQRMEQRKMHKGYRQSRRIFPMMEKQ